MLPLAFSRDEKIRQKTNILLKLKTSTFIVSMRFYYCVFIKFLI